MVVDVLATHLAHATGGFRDSSSAQELIQSLLDALDDSPPPEVKPWPLSDVEVKAKLTSTFGALRTRDPRSHGEGARA